MASLSCSSWWAEFKASSRMSVSALSFSQSSERRSETAVSSLSPSSVVSMILEGTGWSDQSQTPNRVKRFLLLSKIAAIRRFGTYTEEVAETEVLRDEDWFSPPSPPSWGIFGELGAEESGVAISSMSEYVLEPFLMLNALLKELLSYIETEEQGKGWRDKRTVN